MSSPSSPSRTTSTGPAASALLFHELDRSFDRALRACVLPNSTPTLLFSGGVDSALIAAGVRNIARVRLLSVGIAGSKDLAAAQSAAESLSLSLDAREIALSNGERVIEKWRTELAPLREPQRSVAAAFAIALDLAGSGPVLCGQGADELFLGYAHFRGLSASKASELRKVDLRRLKEEDWPLALRMGRTYDAELRAPYLDKDFSTAVLAIPIEAMVAPVQTKPFLRAWARHRGLPENLASRSKRAFQYGSGVRTIIRRVYGN